MACTSLSNLSAADKLQFTKFGFGKALPCPFRCIHHAFEFHTHATPQAIAVEDFGHQITYSELDRQANCLATRLCEIIGVNGNSRRVCLLVERSILMVVGILAVLKAGGENLIMF